MRSQNDAAYYAALDILDEHGVITYDSHTVADMRQDDRRDIGGES